MDARIARLVELTDKTLARREAAARARIEEAQARELVATSETFRAVWNQLYHGARADLELIVAARRIKDWAR